jgi:acyl-CoA synthetase (AMP-forming)/AMP-acid ligase II
MNINFSNYFEALAVNCRDREAIVNVERNRRLTFGQLHQLTNQIVNMMRDDLLLGAGDRFFCILHNDNLSLLHFPTIFKGAVTGVYSNLMDSLEEQARQLEQAQPKVVFVETVFLKTHYEMLRERVSTIVCMDPPAEPLDGVVYFWDLVQKASEKNPDVVLDDRDHIALIRFTGGTTGKGKPVPYSIDNWMALRDACYALPEVDWGERTRTLHMAPLSHGTAALLLPTFFAGGCNVTVNVPDLVHFCEVVSQERITTALAVPTMLYRLLEVPGVDEHDMSTLNNVLYGGAPMSPAKLKLLQQRLGNIFIQCYSASENIAVALSLSKAEHRIATPEDEKRLASAGRTAPSSELCLMDNDGCPVAIGEIGEIWLRSRSTVRGYYNNPEQTAEEFVDGFWKSGDMARMDEDGYVYVVDRKKDMIISGGFNVYATEVEAAIDAHESVLMSAVVAIPHEDWSEAVHAEVVLREGASLTEGELIRHLKQKLGGYKVPKTVAFVEALPLSPVGKLLRRLVREKYWKSSERQVN